MLIVTCDDCKYFDVLCCQHRKKPCHHYKLIFTDGACTNNGQYGATSGIGIALGEEAEEQFLIPITDTEDPGQRRSSQRAELLGALEGVRIPITSSSKHPEGRLPRHQKAHIIIATDSEYVVKGMTEWFPIWKTNDWRASSGKRPSNLDLFLELDAAIKKRESEDNVVIGFWHIPRELNSIADGLAKEAARLAAANA